MMINSIKETVSAIGKSFWWFILMLIAGFWQVLIIWPTSYLVGIPFSQEEVFLSGAVLSFSVALTLSSTIDYLFFEQTSPSFITKSLFYFTPSFTALGCTILFVVSYLKTAGKIAFVDIETIIVSELVILAVTAIYTIAIKLDSCRKCNIP
jgi:hypothetical protein